MICDRCKKEKQLSEYAKDRTTKTGYMRMCKVCDNEKRKNYYLKHIKQENVETLRYLKTERGKQMRRQTYKKNKIKWHARVKLNYEIKKGRIVKNECIMSYLSPCLGRIEGHHYRGYEGENWKEIMWVCRQHHVQEHYLEKLDTLDTTSKGVDS